MLKHGMKIEVMRKRAKAIGFRVTRRVVLDGVPYRYGIKSVSGELVAAYNSQASVWIHLRKLQQALSASGHVEG